MSIDFAELKWPHMSSEVGHILTGAYTTRKLRVFVADLLLNVTLKSMHANMSTRETYQTQNATTQN